MSFLYDGMCEDERFGGYDKGDSRIMNRSEKKPKKKIPTPVVAPIISSPRPLLKKKNSEVKLVVPAKSISENVPMVLPMVLPKIVEEVVEKVKDSWEDDD
jgi:hypothetical protein